MVVDLVLPRSMRVAVIVVSSSLVLTFLQLAEIEVQPFEALLPMAAVLADPFGDVSQRATPKPWGPPLCLATPLDQPRPLQHPEMLGDCRLRHVEWSGQVLDRCLAFGETG